MKDYELLDWQNYKPNMKLAKLAADKVAKQLSLDEEHEVSVAGLMYDSSTRDYIAQLPAKINSNHQLWLAVELDGHFFNVLCLFDTFVPAIVVKLQEIDFGHFHRYEHALNGVKAVCEDCPSNVSRKGKTVVANVR